MANKYLLKPVLKTAKEAFYLEDADGNTVYEGKMTKFSLLFASPFEFIKTVTLEQEGGGLLSILSKRSYFKFDGQKIWDYLHDLGVRIESNVSGEKLGMRYDVTFRGAPLATIANSSPSGKSFLTVDRYYDVTCEEKDLDLAFLVAFSIARTDQTFYS